MFRRTRRFFHFVIMLLTAWVVLVYGLPAVRAAIPGFCARWGLQGGFCTAGVQEKMMKANDFVQRVLRPLPRQPRVQRTFAEVASAFQRLQELLRDRVGDERVDEALRGTEVALRKLETLLGESGDAREKLADVPENAAVLLTRVRDAFERLRMVLGSSSRRAEEVSGALTEAKDALDALSSVLPEEK